MVQQLIREGRRELVVDATTEIFDYKDVRCIVIQISTFKSRERSLLQQLALFGGNSSFVYGDSAESRFALLCEKPIDSSTPRVGVFQASHPP